MSVAPRVGFVVEVRCGGVGVDGRYDLEGVEWYELVAYGMCAYMVVVMGGDIRENTTGVVSSRLLVGVGMDCMEKEVNFVAGNSVVGWRVKRIG